MLNEKAFFEEVQDYAHAKYKGDIYYVANLFAKSLIPSGAGVLDVRLKVEEWARKNNYFVIKDINAEINRTVGRREVFKEWEDIPVTRRDIAFLAREIATVGRRKVLFALLLLGKRYGDYRGEFAVPVATFCEWLGYANASNLYTRIIPWLVANNFIENVTPNYRLRGMYVNEGFFVFKLSYLLFQDKTETIFSVTDNDFEKWSEALDVQVKIIKPPSK